MPPNATADPMEGFAEFAQNYNGPMVNVGQPMATPAQTGLPATHSDPGIAGFLERNAQTIGGVLGGIGGELVDPFGGGIVGAGIGTGIGQEIKNATTGTTTNPFEEGAIGAGSELGGQLLGRAGSFLLNKAGSTAEGMGTKLLSEAGGPITPAVARRTNAADTVRRMDDMGVKPKDYDPVAQQVFDIFTPAVNDAAKSADNVNITGLKDMVDNQINSTMSLGGQVTDKGTPGFKLGSILKNDIDKLNGTAEAENMADPTKALDYVKSLQSDARDIRLGRGAYRSAVPTDEKMAEAGIKQNLADLIEHRIYSANEVEPGIKGAGADNALIDVNKRNALADQLKEVLPDTQASRGLVDRARNATTTKTYRAIQQVFVRASQIAQEKGERLPGTRGLGSMIGKVLPTALGTEQAVFGHGAGQALGIATDIGTAALGTDTGKTLLGSALRKVPGAVEKIQGAQGPSAGPITARDVIQKSVAQSFPHLLGGDGGPGNQSPAAMMSSTGKDGKVVNPSTPSEAMLNQIVNNYVQQVHQSQNNNSLGINLNDPAMVQRILQAGGQSGLDQIENLVKMTQPQLAPEQQSSINLALNSLSSLQQLFPLWQNAIGSGAAGGLLNNLSKVPVVGGNIAGGVAELTKNTTAGASFKTYEDNRYELASNLAKLISGGGRTGGVSGTRAMEEQLPTLSDSPETAMQKLVKVASMINASLSNTLQTPATNTYGALTSFAPPGQTPPLTGGLGATPPTLLPPSLSAQGAF